MMVSVALGVYDGSVDVSVADGLAVHVSTVVSTTKVIRRLGVDGSSMMVARLDVVGNMGLSIGFSVDYWSSIVDSWLSVVNYGLGVVNNGLGIVSVAGITDGSVSVVCTAQMGFVSVTTVVGPRVAGHDGGKAD